MIVGLVWFKPLIPKEAIYDTSREKSPGRLNEEGLTCFRKHDNLFFIGELLQLIVKLEELLVLPFSMIS
jgi:hypothetical protein